MRCLFPPLSICLVTLGVLVLALAKLFAITHLHSVLLGGLFLIAAGIFRYVKEQKKKEKY